MHEAPDTIVLIHGMWMTARSWEDWANRYRTAGYNVIAPNWPGLDGDVESLRKDPSPLAGLGIAQIVDHYERIIRDLDRPPIIMGHSFGGTFTQVLLDRGLGAVGVAIDSASVKGVLKLPMSTLRTAWPALRNPANRKKAIPLSLKQFRWRITSHLDLAASAGPYANYYIPGSGRVLFEGGLANFNSKAPTAVNFHSKTRPPLLFIAGGKDHVSPPALNRANHKKQRKATTKTELKVFPGRTHFTLGQNGWEDVADYALAWALSAIEQPAPTGQSATAT